MCSLKVHVHTSSPWSESTSPPGGCEGTAEDEDVYVGGGSHKEQATEAHKGQRLLCSGISVKAPVPEGDGQLQSLPLAGAVIFKNQRQRQSCQRTAVSE